MVPFQFILYVVRVWPIRFSDAFVVAALALYFALVPHVRLGKDAGKWQKKLGLRVTVILFEGSCLLPLARPLPGWSRSMHQTSRQHRTSKLPETTSAVPGSLGVFCLFLVDCFRVCLETRLWLVLGVVVGGGAGGGGVMSSTSLPHAHPSTTSTTS